jgi:hypothetical protein
MNEHLEKIKEQVEAAHSHIASLDISKKQKIVKWNELAISIKTIVYNESKGEL